MAFASRFTGMQYRSEINSSLSDVLQSEPVRRLFNQPNIVIKTLPTKTTFVPSPEWKHGARENYHIPRQPDLSIHVIANANDKKEEHTYLPSKNNGKSDIALIPIVNEIKECGHCEPCESLVCDVIVQQYEDREGISPLVAINIDEDEINAPVAKHCENEKCDALCIDHDRCRRVSIQLCKCDKSTVCDICGTTFDDSNDRLTHKECKRKDEYRHNKADREQILRIRMRERELQIIEAAKTRNSADYLDPVHGHNRALEAIKRNEELLVIAKPTLLTNHKPMHINNHRVSTGNREIFNEVLPNLKNTSNMYSTPMMFTPQQNFTNVKIQPNITVQTNRTMQPNRVIQPNRPIQPNLTVQPSITIQQNPVFGVSNSNSPTPSKQIRLENVNGVNPPIYPNQQPLFNTIGSSALQPSMTALNNWLISQSQINPSTITQPFMMGNTPVRVVPIANLKSQPSLLHQAQGVPRFCIVADSSVPPIAPKPILQPKVSVSVKSKSEATSLEENAEEEVLTNKSEKKGKKVLKAMPKLIPKFQVTMADGKKRLTKYFPLKPNLSSSTVTTPAKLFKPRLRKKKPKSRKSAAKYKRSNLYNCTYCEKRFCSLAYCKMHIAQHESEISCHCKICEKPFTKKVLLQKHVATEHNEGQVRCEICGHVADSSKDLDSHRSTKAENRELKCSECNELCDTCNDLNKHLCDEHGSIVCPQCKEQIAKVNFKKHFVIEHSMSDASAEKMLTKLSNSTESVSETIVDNGNIENNELETKAISIDNEADVKETNGFVPEPKKKKKSEVPKPVIVTRTRSPRLRPSNTSNIYKCTICRKVFENERQLQIHMANNGSRLVVCPACGSRFHRKKDLAEHSSVCEVQSVDQSKPKVASGANKRGKPVDKSVLSSSLDDSLQTSERKITDENKTEVPSNSVQPNDSANENVELSMGCESVKASTEDISNINEEERTKVVTEDVDLTVNCDMTETIAETVVNTHVKQLDEISDVNSEL